MADFIGDGGDNNLLGTDFADLMEGRGGDDTLQGRLGKDQILGGQGSDRLYGSSGRDTMDGGAGNDFLQDDEDGERDIFIGGDGNDTMLGAVKDDLQGGDGFDVVALSLTGGPVQDIDMSAMGAGGSFTFTGGTTISGFEDGNILFGFGDDRVVAPDVAMVLSGNTGADTLIGGGQDDSLFGGLDFEKDVIQGGGGRDRITGALGDRLDGGGGSDSFELNLIFAVDGFDVDFSPVAMGGAVNVGQGTRLAGFERGFVTFGEGADKVRTGAADLNVDGYRGNDTLLGGGADNTLAGGEDDDLISGGDGDDTAEYQRASSGVTVRLGVAGYQDTGGAGLDRLLSIENLLGSHNADSLRGDDLANRLDGGNGDDVLVGGEGDDTLMGGQSGSDRLTGGLGRDRLNGGSEKDFFVFTSTAETTTGDPDIIVDLSSDDVIHLKAIDANAGVGGDQAFHVVSALSGAAGELAITFNGTFTSFLLDVDGDGTADARIVANGDHTGHTGFQL